MQHRARRIAAAHGVELRLNNIDPHDDNRHEYDRHKAIEADDAQKPACDRLPFLRYLLHARLLCLVAHARVCRSRRPGASSARRMARIFSNTSCSQWTRKSGDKPDEIGLATRLRLFKNPAEMR